MRIGILGGTFDPIHKGHLALAHAALRQLRLDRVIFIPAHRHPLEEKQSAVLTSPKARLHMVKLALKGKPKFKVSDCELKRKGISYTVDTLRFFRRRYPKPHELFFVTGGDWGKRLDRWREIDTIFSLARFVVAKRPGFDIRRLPKQVEALDFRPLKISSTQIRRRLREGKSLTSLVPKIVSDYIVRHTLYRS
jgi:nicotinate-nucleotide adenylyltransferase